MRQTSQGIRRIGYIVCRTSCSCGIGDKPFARGVCKKKKKKHNSHVRLSSFALKICEIQNSAVLYLYNY